MAWKYCMAKNVVCPLLLHKILVTVIFQCVWNHSDSKKIGFNEAPTNYIAFLSL